MPIQIGEVEKLLRYPVKSMMGESLDVADLGWYGLDGDRRLAFRRADDRSGFPWLTASKLPELILFAPSGGDPLPMETCQRTFVHPKGRNWPCLAANWRRRSAAVMARRSK